jgi:hypothetical protein
MKTSIIISVLALFIAVGVSAQVPVQYQSAKRTEVLPKDTPNAVTHDDLIRNIITIRSLESFIEVTASEDEYIRKVEVFDLNGRLQLSQTCDDQQVNIPSSDLATGIYIVTATGRVSYKVDKVFIM